MGLDIDGNGIDLGSVSASTELLHEVAARGGFEQADESALHGGERGGAYLKAASGQDCSVLVQRKRRYAILMGLYLNCFHIVIKLNDSDVADFGIGAHNHAVVLQRRHSYQSIGVGAGFGDFDHLEVL